MLQLGQSVNKAQHPGDIDTAAHERGQAAVVGTGMSKGNAEKHGHMRTPLQKRAGEQDDRNMDRQARSWGSRPEDGGTGCGYVSQCAKTC